MKVCNEICHPYGAPPQGFPCGNPPTLFEQGKDWCRAHAPSRVATKETRMRDRQKQRARVLGLSSAVRRAERDLIEAAKRWHETATGIDVLNRACATLVKAEADLRAASAPLPK